MRTDAEQAAKTRVASLLLGAYRLQVLALLLLHPEEAFHVRELARRTGVPAGSLPRELKVLAEAGLLHRATVGNQVRYQAEPFSPFYRGIVSILNEAATARPYRPAGRSRGRQNLRAPLDEIAQICRRYGVKRLSLFGSAARGELRSGSDVDLLVEFDPSGATTSVDLVHMQEQLSRAFGDRRVEIASPAILKNPLRRKAIERDLKLLYAA